MKKSISRIINKDDGNLLAMVDKQEKFIGSWEIEKAFGNVPKGRYKVTYTLSEKGKYKVGEYDNADMYLVRPGDHNGNMAVCFLPKEWAEMRVTRKVEILPKRRAGGWEDT